MMQAEKLFLFFERTKSKQRSFDDDKQCCTLLRLNDNVLDTINGNDSCHAVGLGNARQHVAR